MRRLCRVIVIICAMMTLETVASASSLAELRCDHALCVAGANTGRYFTVEGHAVYVRVDGDVSLEVDCGGWAALDSSAMPRFASAVAVSGLRLRACPPPAQSSLSAALAALNVTLQQDNENTTLHLEHLPASPQLTTAHFAALTHLTHLKITSTLLTAQNSILSFLTTLPNLHSLEIYRLPPPAADKNLNKTFADVKLSETTIKPLTETLPTEREKDVEVKSLKNLTTETIKRVNLTSELVDVWINDWEDRQVAPLRLCDSLKYFHFLDAKVEELPDRWVTACPCLQHLAVWRAKHLTKLPAKLLEGATALQILDFSNGVLESVPDGFLLSATNLTTLYLFNNHLTTLTSASFTGPSSLEVLLVQENQLTNEAMQAIASLTTLTTLDISKNPLSNLCERNGYSMLKNLTKLYRFSVTDLNITHLCRDWSEMKFLYHLDFSNTHVTELDFADIYLSKEPGFGRVMMYVIEGVNLNKLIFTEDEYRLAIKTPPETGLFFTDNGFRRDCKRRHSVMLENKKLSWIPRTSCMSLEIIYNE